MEAYPQAGLFKPEVYTKHGLIPSEEVQILFGFLITTQEVSEGETDESRQIPSSGGKQVTINGRGFPNSLEKVSQYDINITIGGQICEIFATSASEMRCWSPPLELGDAVLFVNSPVSNAFIEMEVIEPRYNLTAISPNQVPVFQSKFLAVTYFSTF